MCSLINEFFKDTLIPEYNLFPSEYNSLILKIFFSKSINFFVLSSIYNCYKSQYLSKFAEIR